MRKFTTTHTVYKFDELKPEAQDKAIWQHANFEIEVYDGEVGYVKQAVDKAEANQTPWFATEILVTDSRNELIDTIKANEYEFYENGVLA